MTVPTTRRGENQVKEARKGAGFTLRTLAEKTGITESYLSKVERGEAENPSRPAKFAIAAALGGSVLDLFPDTEPDRSVRIAGTMEPGLPQRQRVEPEVALSPNEVAEATAAGVKL